ncbi:MAG: hypothetical protein QME78_07350 [Thermodesulfobacteriota bacterium]|nr:hypothetical protein [Thermodesulfobacteriota bacterium]
MTLYGERDGLVRPVLQIAMPRPLRIYAPGGTMHVVARCNNREFYFAAPEDFEILLDHLGEMGSAYGVRLFAYTLMSNIFTCSSNLLLRMYLVARFGGS